MKKLYGRDLSVTQSNNNVPLLQIRGHLSYMRRIDAVVEVLCPNGIWQPFTLSMDTYD